MSSTGTIEEVVALVRRELSVRADAEKAAGMQAYMKTTMPFYGVQKAGRVQVIRLVRRQFTPATHTEYVALCRALWALPHREEKYLAQAVATTYREFLTPGSLPLYRRFIVEGAWWDFVDETATHMVRELVLDYPDRVWPKVDVWNTHPDMWLRRASIICQIGAKESTDVERLFRFCLNQADDTAFFIRKAIGWALREFAKTDPDSVAAFMTANREVWSPLTWREATKHIADRVAD